MPTRTNKLPKIQWVSSSNNNVQACSNAFCFIFLKGGIKKLKHFSNNIVYFGETRRSETKQQW